MRIALVGPGRAGTALCLAARAAGHTIVSVSARRPDAAEQAAGRLSAVALDLDSPISDADLLILAVRDDAISSVAGSIEAEVPSAVHLSGAIGVDVLAPLAEGGLAVGSFHPLQTIPSPEAGAAALSGAWIAVTSKTPDLVNRLFGFAESLGAHPFEIADVHKPLYHAAAAAAANFPLAVLTMANGLADRAGLPWEAARPLVEAVIANAFEFGPRRSLTGPVARGDVDTVRRQMAAVAAHAPEWESFFRSMVLETANIAGTSGLFEEYEE